MSGTAEDDSYAVTCITKGEASGLEALYDRHATAIYSLALRIVRDVGEAEDVTQEVFTQVWASAGRYDASRGSVAAWVLVIARSRALDRLRRRRIVLKPGLDADRLDEIPDPTPSVELTAATDEQVRAAQSALATLPQHERAALELAYYEGLTQVEIAERTATPLGTVKTRIRNGLRRIREVMTTSEPFTSHEP
ncbi:MAG: sigma-70 family RNA polymerase sigma factor [Vicinamibacterales bacterium]